MALNESNKVRRSKETTCTLQALKRAKQLLDDKEVERRHPARIGTAYGTGWEYVEHWYFWHTFSGT